MADPRIVKEESGCDVYDVTIASGASLSDAIDVRGVRAPAVIEMPASWTAAALTFQTSYDGVTFKDYYSLVSEVSATSAAASRSIFLPINEFAGIRFLKIRSGTSAAPVNQAAERVLKLITREAT